MGMYGMQCTCRVVGFVCTVSCRSSITRPYSSIHYINNVHTSCMTVVKVFTFECINVHVHLYIQM